GHQSEICLCRLGAFQVDRPYQKLRTEPGQYPETHQPSLSGIAAEWYPQALRQIHHTRHSVNVSACHRNPSLRVAVEALQSASGTTARRVVQVLSEASGPVQTPLLMR